jgi:DNA-binding FadR family transcriptional regulator
MRVDAALQRLEPAESVAERTYAALRQALLRREIKAGERLYETTVAARLGVSRTPVREALTRLVAEGLAEEVRGSRGVIVRDIQKELALPRNASLPNGSRKSNASLRISPRACIRKKKTMLRCIAMPS